MVLRYEELNIIATDNTQASIPIIPLVIDGQILGNINLSLLAVGHGE